MGKLLLCIALAVVLVSIPVYSTTINTCNGEIFCDGITCPKGSTTCTVSKKTFGDLKSYKYTRLCTDANGVVTHKFEQELPNPYPGTHMNSVSSAGGSRSFTVQEKKEFDATMNKVRQDTNRVLDNQRCYWDQWKHNFEDDMEDMFPPGFPFV